MTKFFILIILLFSINSCSRNETRLSSAEPIIKKKDEMLLILLNLYEQHTSYNKVVEIFGPPLESKSGRDKKILFYRKAGIIPEKVIWFDDNLKTTQIHYFPQELSIDDLQHDVYCKNWLTKEIKRAVGDLITKDSYLICAERDIKASVSIGVRKVIKEIIIGKLETFIKL